MAMKVSELKNWLSTLPNKAEVGIDEGGLQLQVVGNEDVYVEVGGLPEEE